MKEFIVKVWETEYDRNKGECNSYYFDTLDEALAEAKSFNVTCLEDLT